MKFPLSGIDSFPLRQPQHKCLLARQLNPQRASPRQQITTTTPCVFGELEPVAPVCGSACPLHYRLLGIRPVLAESPDQYSPTRAYHRQQVITAVLWLDGHLSIWVRQYFSYHAHNVCTSAPGFGLRIPLSIIKNYVHDLLSFIRRGKTNFGPFGYALKQGNSTCKHLENS